MDLVGRCGDSLGERAALYSTAYAADDLAAVLEMLDVGPIDLYGDSYGTYFEQVFAVRHPRTLRSVVLDGAYPLNGPDYAWYPTYAPAMRAKFDIVVPALGRRAHDCPAAPSTISGPRLEALRRRLSPRAPSTATAMSATFRPTRRSSPSSCSAARRPWPRSRKSTPRPARSWRTIARRSCGSWRKPSAESIPAIRPPMPPNGAPDSPRR